MAPLATRRTLLSLLRDHGSVPVVVVDVDSFSRFAADVGEAKAADVLGALRRILERVAGRSADVHTLERDRFLVALPSHRYDEAVSFAERVVDDVRAMNVACPVSVVPSGKLSATAVVTLVENVADVERFERRVNDLLRDGKSTGGDVAVRDR